MSRSTWRTSSRQCLSRCCSMKSNICGEQRRLLGAQHVGHCQVGGVQRVELGREQLGIEFHLLLRRQLFGDLLDQPVDVFLARAGGKDRARTPFRNPAARRVDVGLGQPAASSRPAFCQRPTSSAMNSRSSFGPSSALEIARIAGAPVRAWSRRTACVAFIVAGSSSRAACRLVRGSGSIRPRCWRAASTTAVCFSASL